MQCLAGYQFCSPRESEPTSKYLQHLTTRRNPKFYPISLKPSRVNDITILSRPCQPMFLTISLNIPAFCMVSNIFQHASTIYLKDFEGGSPGSFVITELAIYQYRLCGESHWQILQSRFLFGSFSHFSSCRGDCVQHGWIPGNRGKEEENITKLKHVQERKVWNIQYNESILAWSPVERDQKQSWQGPFEKTWKNRIQLTAQNLSFGGSNCMSSLDSRWGKCAFMRSTCEARSASVDCNARAVLYTAIIAPQISSDPTSRVEQRLFSKKEK